MNASRLPVRGAVYEIELCSGERRRWQYLGTGGGDCAWRDVEDGREFGEQSLMYAWQLVTRIDRARGSKH